MSEQENKNKHSTPDNQSGGDQQKGNQGFQWKQAGKTSLIWVIILISAIFVSGQIGRAHVWTPVTDVSRMPSSA